MIVVDDNKLLLDDFIAQFQWEENGYQIIATAANAIQGIAKCKQLRPDILITDIMMPGMDGLEMLQLLADEGLMPLTFLLSSYDEFSYAKQGFNLGVIDYLLKNEITPELLAEKLDKAKKRVIAQREHQISILRQDLQHLMTDNFIADPAFRNTMLSCILICADLPIPVNNMVPYQINLIPALDGLNSASAFKGIVSAFEIIIPYVIIAVLDDTYSKHPVDVQTLIGQIGAIWDRYLDIRHTIVLIDKPLSLRQLHMLLKDRAVGLSAHYFLQEKPWYQLSDFSRSVSPGISLSEYRNKIISAIDTMNLANLRTSLQTAYRLIIEKADYEMLITFTNEIIQLAKAYQNRLPENLRTSIDEDFLFYRAMDIADRMARCFERLFQLTDNVYSPVVNHAVHYIYSHFSEQDLSADKIAGAVHVSTNYLHKKFKDETGNTLNGFITDLRIRQSKLLLAGTSLKTNEIAEKVGFISTRYYHKLFAKHTGQSVAEYRKGIK